MRSVVSLVYPEETIQGPQRRAAGCALRKIWEVQATHGLLWGPSDAVCREGEREEEIFSSLFQGLQFGFGMLKALGTQHCLASLGLEVLRILEDCRDINGDTWQWQDESPARWFGIGVKEQETEASFKDPRTAGSLAALLYRQLCELGEHVSGRGCCQYSPLDSWDFSSQPDSQSPYSSEI